MSMGQSECRCGVLMVGAEPTAARNWNPDCLEHGTESAWWNSDEQKVRRAAQSERLRALQVQARDARHGR